MNTRRRNRLVATVFLLGGTAITVALVLTALDESVNLFYPPERVVNGEAPSGVTIRAGGMVADGSVTHDTSGLGVSFVLTDYQGSDFTVRYVGILPDLFREGAGHPGDGRTRWRARVPGVPGAGEARRELHAAGTGRNHGCGNPASTGRRRGRG